MLPVIGVTASVSDDRLSFQQKRMYCEAISACGGLPLILPPQEDVSRASQVLSLLNGLLLAGGDDIDPAYYDEKTLPECGLITPIRDTWEMPLCREALRRHLPLLGICRGLQVLMSRWAAHWFRICRRSALTPPFTTSRRSRRKSRHIPCGWMHRAALRASLALSR